MSIKIKQVEAQPVTFKPVVLQITIDNKKDLEEFKEIFEELADHGWDICVTGLTITQDNKLTDFLRDIKAAL